MKKSIFITGVLFFALSFGLVARAETVKSLIAVCSDIEGPQTYYFTKYRNNQDNQFKENIFYDHESRITKTDFVLVWKVNEKEAKIGLVDSQTEELKDGVFLSHLATEKDLMGKTEQITFSGLWNSAPVLVSIYPKENILIYSQHSVWTPPAAEGIRTFMFHAKCLIELN